MKSLLSNTRRAEVTFADSGQISISARVARIIDARPGDAIDVLCDGSDFYLYVSHRAKEMRGARYEATCYPAVRGGQHIRANSRRLCETILDICRRHRRVALPVGETRIDSHGRTLITLLTCLPQ